jgi:hypothetical protein
MSIDTGKFYGVDFSPFTRIAFRFYTILSCDNIECGRKVQKSTKRGKSGSLVIREEYRDIILMKKRWQNKSGRYLYAALTIIPVFIDVMGNIICVPKAVLAENG